MIDQHNPKDESRNTKLNMKVKQLLKDSRQAMYRRHAHGDKYENPYNPDMMFAGQGLLFAAFFGMLAFASDPTAKPFGWFAFVLGLLVFLQGFIRDFVNWKYHFDMIKNNR